MGGTVKGKQSRWDWRIRVGNGENMFCKNCGKEIKEGDAFCGRCGTPVLTQTKEPKGSSAGVAKQKKKLVSPVIVVILAIVAVGTGGTLFVNSDRYQSRKNMKLAEEMYRSEKYEEAISYYEEALKLDNSIARAYAGEAYVRENTVIAGKSVTDYDSTGEVSKRKELLTILREQEENMKNIAMTETEKK